MSLIHVNGNILTFADQQYRCAIGKGGFSTNKREGDGCTPIGTYALRECWYRLDRLPPPQTNLPLKIIHETDGWCDDAENPDYNTHIVIPPHGGIRTPRQARGDKQGYENLWRADHVYDLIIPLGYNDAPITPGKGSAIFMHVAKPDYAPTEGCVALALTDLLAILPHLDTQTRIEISQS